MIDTLDSKTKNHNFVFQLIIIIENTVIYINSYFKSDTISNDDLIPDLIIIITNHDLRSIVLKYN